MAERVNVGDERQVIRRKKLDELAREREVEELRVVLQTIGGRAVIYRILGQGNPTHNVTTDPQESFRQIGRQDVGRYILEEVFTSDPNAYTVMRLEAMEREK